MNPRYNQFNGKIIEGFGYVPACQKCGESIVFDPSKLCYRCVQRLKKPSRVIFSASVNVLLFAALIAGLIFLVTR